MNTIPIPLLIFYAILLSGCSIYFGTYLGMKLSKWAHEHPYEEVKINKMKKHIEELKSNIKYLQPIINPNKQNSLWYGGDVATIAYKGFIFTLTANGDVIGQLWLPEPYNSLIFMKDKSNHAIFNEKFKQYLLSDEDIHEALANEPSNEIKWLQMEDTNWWEIFVTKNGQQITSVICDSENYEEAIDEMIDQMDTIIEESKPTIFVYHEYQDDLPYGEQQTKLFLSKQHGSDYLKHAVETTFQTTWEDFIKQNTDEENTITDTYVSVKLNDICYFFTLQPMKTDDMEV